jgi:hypothetical protein
MNRRRVGRLAAASLAVLGLFGVVAAAAIVLAGTELGSLGGQAVAPTGRPAATPSPSPSPWLIATAPGQVRMPDTANCAACHVNTSGTVGVNPIPVIAHPVDGWRQCTACHATDRLVKTAPGHSGIHADECLVCHTRSSAAAPAPKHPAMPNVDCLVCHGSSAPLPHDMATKASTLCWLCHHSPTSSPAPAPVVGAGSQRSSWRLEAIPD